MAVAVGCYMWFMGSLMGAQAAYKSMMCWWLLLGRPRTSALKIMGFMMLFWPAQPPVSEKDEARHQTSGTLPSDNQARHVGRCDFRPRGPSLPEMARY
jgi:hypothetical protein